jgi:hypothetical protein
MSRGHCQIWGVSGSKRLDDETAQVNQGAVSRGRQGCHSRVQEEPGSDSGSSDSSEAQHCYERELHLSRSFGGK